MSARATTTLSSTSIATTNRYPARASASLSADGTRAYLGGHSGVWRSPTTVAAPGGTSVAAASRRYRRFPGTLLVPSVYDLLISRRTTRTSSSPRWVAMPGAPTRAASGGPPAGRLVEPGHQFVRAGVVEMASCLAVAPDPRPQPDLGRGRVRGCPERRRQALRGQRRASHAYGGPTSASGTSWLVAVSATAGVYAVGSRVWYSLNGGRTWRVEPMALALGAVRTAPASARAAIGIHPPELPGALHCRRSSTTRRSTTARG